MHDMKMQEQFLLQKKILLRRFEKGGKLNPAEINHKIVGKLK